MVCTAHQYLGHGLNSNAVYGSWYVQHCNIMVMLCKALQYMGHAMNSTAISWSWYVQHFNILVMVYTAP